jgi:hypothetical protein
LDLFGGHFGDPAAPADTIAGNVFLDACHEGKIALGNGLALGAGKVEDRID